MDVTIIRVAAYSAWGPAAMILKHLVNHLWQTTLFVAVAALLTVALRINHARARYWLWLAASCKFLVPFSILVTLGGHLGWTPPAATHARHAPYAVVIESTRLPLAINVSTDTLAAVAHESLRRGPVILLVVWACGFLGVTLSWWVRWRGLRAVVRDASPLPQVGALAVRSSSSLLEPGVFGILHPVLLLPEGITDRLTPAQMESIVEHELCHVRHRDNLAAALHMVVSAIFWFHPLVWWIGAKLVDERERACDEEVLKLGNEPHVYAQSILKVCEFYLESPLACVAGVTGSNLKRRIEGIMRHQVGRKLNFARKVLLGGMGLAALAWPIAVGLLNAPASHAQTAQTVSKPAFEVASIKPSKADEHRVQFQIAPGGRFTATNANVKMLIEQAYGVRDFQVAGAPGWLGSDRFDIMAKGSEGEKIDQEKLKLMLQSLLADRFQMTLHRETKELPVYALVTGKNGAKLQEAEKVDKEGKEAKGGMLRMGRGQLTGQGVSMEMLAANLARQVGRSVIDKTGLTGKYNFKLDWTPDAGERPGPPEGPHDNAPAPPAESAGPSIFTAIQEQLGLKLESQKGPVEILHIDRIEKPSEN